MKEICINVMYAAGALAAGSFAVYFAACCVALAVKKIRGMRG